MTATDAHDAHDDGHDDGLKSDHFRISVLVGLLFGIPAMGSAAVAISLPALAKELDLTTGASVWTVSLYSLVLAVTTPIYGRLADRAGIRGPLMIGVGLMAAGAVLGAFAPTYPFLLCARFLQAAGAGAIPTLSLAIVTTRYEGAERVAAAARVAGVGAAVTCLGPLAGGVIAELFTWRAVIAVPAIGVLAVPLLWSAVSSEGLGARLDLLGAALVAGTAAGVILLVQSPSSGPAVTTAGALLSVLGVPAVMVRVRRKPNGFLPLSVMSNRVVTRGALAVSAAPAGWFALLIATPAVLVAHGWTMLEVGFVLLPSAIAGLTAPRAMAPLLRRLGPVKALMVSDVAVVGALCIAAAGAALASAFVMVAAVVVVTMAFGLGYPATTSVVRETVDPDVRGIALGMTNLVFFIGGGVGSATVGGLSGIVGLPQALLVLAALPLAGIAALAWPRATRTR